MLPEYYLISGQTTVHACLCVSVRLSVHAGILQCGSIHASVLPSVHPSSIDPDSALLGEAQRQRNPDIHNKRWVQMRRNVKKKQQVFKPDSWGRVVGNNSYFDEPTIQAMIKSTKVNI